MNARLPLLLLVVAAVSAVTIGAAAQRRGAAPRELRLYIFDCGTLESADMSRYRLTASDVQTTKMSVSCYLVAHPKGLLLWDAGAVPDGAWVPTGAPMEQHIVLPDGQTRTVTLTKPLKADQQQEPLFDGPDELMDLPIARPKP